MLAAGAIAAWTRLPDDYTLRRSLALEERGERIVEVSEGVSEVIAVTEVPGRGRALMTNGHPMSSTALLDQRYMRALAHIPLLSMDHPERVLVIGFGVGNTAHAATLHPSVRRVEVADLSSHVLEQAPFFRDANGGVLSDPRVAVYVNDGRQHLQMQPEGVYDSHHARTAAHRAGRRGGAVFARVLRAGPEPAEGGRLHESVAAGLSGADRDEPGHGARLRGRVSPVGAALGHRGRVAPSRHDGADHPDRSVARGRAAAARAGGRSRPPPPRPRHDDRDCRELCRLCADAGPRNP